MNNQKSKESFTTLKEQLKGVISSLTPFEQQVIAMRFGLNEKYSHSLEEVSKKFNISIQEIRIIEVKIIRKLRLKKKNEEQNTQKKINYSSLQKDVISILDSLPTKEKEIVKKKYGLIDGTKTTNDNIFQEFHITNNELDKIIAKVKRRLSHKPDEIINVKI